MGSLYYPWADIAADAGLVVRVTGTNSGWERRARSSGGFPAVPLGVMWHHAASSTSTSDEACVNYQVRGNPDNPVGNITIGRNGDVWPIAGGASNCSGKGGPMTFSRGQCKADSGNTQLVNIECNNNGVGEPWSTALIDAYFALSNALNAYLGNAPTDVTSHALGAGDGYTNRKIDPATAAAVQGPWRPASVNPSGTWSLADMRAECSRRASSSSLVPPTPEDPPMTADEMTQVATLTAQMVWSQQLQYPGGSLAPAAALEQDTLDLVRQIGTLCGQMNDRLAALEARG
jgi:hypothetical protein